MNTIQNTLSLINALQGVANAYKLHVTKVDASLLNLSDGELLANVNGLANRCNELSVWSTEKDFAIRIDENYLNTLNRVQKFALDNCFAYKLKKQKNKANERRYSFSDYKDVLYFLSTLIAYKSVETKEIATVESVIA